MPYGETAFEPAPPFRDGYVFAGWFTQATGGNLFDFSEPISGNITLHARWDEFVIITSPPSINGPGNLTLGEGYENTHTPPFDIAGTPPLSVTTDNDYGGLITWNYEYSRLDIAPGLGGGEYTVAGNANSIIIGGDISVRVTPGVMPGYFQTVPEQTEPDQGEFGRGEPDDNEPDRVEPEPDDTEPDSAEPDINESEGGEPEPDNTEPEHVEPDINEPEHVEPDNTEPGYVEPPNEEPGHVIPDYVVPDKIEPEYQ